MTNNESAQKYRYKNINQYREYQRIYKSKRYYDPDIRKGLLDKAKLKYYYSSDPLPSIRKLYL